MSNNREREALSAITTLLEETFDGLKANVVAAVERGPGATAEALADAAEVLNVLADGVRALMLAPRCENPHCPIHGNRDQLPSEDESR